MPKLHCPCGYVHNLSPIPDAGLMTIPADARGYVALAVSNGWLTLNNGSFNPNNSITRSDLANAIVGYQASLP